MEILELKCTICEIKKKFTGWAQQQNGDKREKESVNLRVDQQKSHNEKS